MDGTMCVNAVFRPARGVFYKGRPMQGQDDRREVSAFIRLYIQTVGYFDWVEISKAIPLNTGLIASPLDCWSIYMSGRVVRSKQPA